MMGTSWAVNALVQALPAPAGEKLKQPAQLDFAPVEQEEWVRTALSGSAAELKKLLDSGMKADAKTAAGTTALMLAAHDPEKVKLLLARGADVNARAATGITALMVAARYRGNVEVVSLLLQKGAGLHADKPAEVINEASAMFFAVMAGDLQTAGALLKAGAKVGFPMKVLGQFVIGPVTYASVNDDSKMVEFLIGKGANANEVDPDGISALGWATLTNHANTIQALLARGARVNHVDNFGMTPLLYAASVDFGETSVLQKLIAGGADLKIKNKEGLSALDLAKNYNHTKAADFLANKIASR
jgi:ankyrin repeat protein